MRFIHKLALAAIVAVAAMGLNVAVASATHFEVQSGGSAFTGHVVGSSADSVFETEIGDINCNESDFEGTIDTSEVEGTTEVGMVPTLTFTQNGDHECPDTIGPISDCEVELNAPLDVAVNGAPPRLIFNGVSVTLHCIAFGFIPIECNYGGNISATFALESNQAVFTSQTLGGGTSPCPETGDFSATYNLTTEAGAPVVLESVK